MLVISKWQLRDELERLGISESLYEITSKGCLYPSIDDPFSEKLHSFYDTLLHAVSADGFTQARKAYKPKLLQADRTIKLLREEHNDFVTRA